MSALGGVLAVASFRQMLVVMLSAIDLSVPAIIAASADIVVHCGGREPEPRLVIAAALVAAVLISTVNGVLI